MPFFTRQEMRDGKNNVRASFHDALSHMVTFIARRALQEEQRRTIMSTTTPYSPRYSRVLARRD